ncbi:hypothetical protein FGG08_005045 [Glutinoglossum americanum]|uniref:Uncharacterized protein n=1 Tax=Glutinoglossum americanum TaxID=1670608 RepID=A0A9P8KWE7_9PEZI|nr:hypothetical protein FGG08_005045 [Glutinoglossum americanum]
MVRRGAAVARDPNAPPTHEMEVHGLENPPWLLAQLAGGISAFARNVRDRFRPISGTRFQEIRPIGYPPRESATKNIPGLFQPVRIDRFPWIDINDPATLNNGPAKAAISQGIEDAQQHGLFVDDIDPDWYTEYRNEYLTRYIVKPGIEFFYDTVEYQAGRKPNNRFPSSELKHASSRQAAIELLFDNTSESKQKHLNTPKKRSNAPAMLTYDEWLAREHSFHRRLWAAERLYDQTPADTSFIARDKNNIPVLAVFPNWLEES